MLPVTCTACHCLISTHIAITGLFVAVRWRYGVQDTHNFFFLDLPSDSGNIVKLTLCGLDCFNQTEKYLWSLLLLDTEMAHAVKPFWNKLKCIKI